MKLLIAVVVALLCTNLVPVSALEELPICEPGCHLEMRPDQPAKCVCTSRRQGSPRCRNDFECFWRFGSADRRLCRLGRCCRPGHCYWGADDL